MAVHDSRDWEGARSDSALGLRNLLKQVGLITDEQSAQYERSLGEEGPIAYFSIKGIFSEEDAIQAISRHLSLEIFRASEHNLNELHQLLESEPACHFAPKEWQEMRAVPVFVLPHEVTIAMADPLDMQAHHRLQFSFGRPVNIIIGKESEISAVLCRSLAEEDRDAVELIVNNKAEDTPAVTQVQTSATQFESSIKEDDPSAAPVVRLVNKIFARAISTDASDLHLTPQKEGIEVKARIDGIMQSLVQVPERMKNPVIARVKLLCGMDISEKRRPQDGRLRITTNYGVKDLRISAVPSAHGENLVARILSSSVKATSFQELGFSKDLMSRLGRVLKRNCKVNLVVGPTGSGKTSTLYAGLLHLHDGSRNIITLEDPIEYRIDGITQIQVNPRIEFNFAEGLRSILRQDPDVVLVGEIRDEETAAISMKTAQTGHLVLSTLHTNSAVSAVTRLLDLGVPDYLIASSLGSVLAQRLVRKLCEHCSKKLTKKEREKYGLSTKAKKPCGCEKCRDTGYSGRIAVFSLLEITDQIAAAIRDGADESYIEQLARNSGFQPLSEAARALVEQGVTSAEEVERVIGDFSTSEFQGEAVAPSVKSASSEKETSGLLSQPRVLLVEDDADQREIYGSILESEMFDVVMACNGKEALKKLTEEQVDVVVCDLMMPELDGLSFVKRLRGHKETSALPVLMLTAAGTEENELHGMSNGADDFISKASSVNVLLARVRRLVERASLGKGSH